MYLISHLGETYLHLIVKKKNKERKERTFANVHVMMLASIVGPVGAIGCTVGTQTILNRISGYI